MEEFGIVDGGEAPEGIRLKTVLLNMTIENYCIFCFISHLHVMLILVKISSIVAMGLAKTFPCNI